MLVLRELPFYRATYEGGDEEEGAAWWGKGSINLSPLRKTPIVSVDEIHLPGHVSIAVTTLQDVHTCTLLGRPASPPKNPYL